MTTCVEIFDLQLYDIIRVHTRIIQPTIMHNSQQCTCAVHYRYDQGALHGPCALRRRQHVHVLLHVGLELLEVDLAVLVRVDLRHQHPHLLLRQVAVAVRASECE